MNPNKRELILKEEVFKIVGAAMEVSNCRLIKSGRMRSSTSGMD